MHIDKHQSVAKIERSRFALQKSALQEVDIFNRKWGPKLDSAQGLTYIWTSPGRVNNSWAVTSCEVCCKMKNLYLFSFVRKIYWKLEILKEKQLHLYFLNLIYLI